ncbi:MAG: hypothetical protein KA184_05820 [Candidatus Hydrogenedentes bacterium]|nr:hypothetical protein [Candidatus Hydrogenedentota bacterium]
MRPEIRDEKVREADCAPEQLQVRVLKYVPELGTGRPLGVEASRLLRVRGRTSEEDVPLRRTGKMPHGNGLRMAALALPHDVTLVTRDKHFPEGDDVIREQWQ